jgi:hypothetical protein
MASGPPAYGYQPPPPYYKRSLDTEKGLRHINWGIIIYLIATLLILIAVIIMLVFIQSLIGTTDPSDVGAIIGPIIGAVGLICGGGVLFLVALILWLLGLYEMYAGRAEFGEMHASRVYRAVIFIVLYIVFMVVSQIVGMALIGFSFDVNPADYLESLRISAIVLAVLGIVSTIILGLAFVFLIVELCNEKFKRILWAAFYVFILVTIVGNVISIVPLYAVDVSGLTTEEVSQLSNLGSLALGLSFIPFILFFVCFRHAHDRVKGGDIQPVPGAYAAGYPVPPGYQQPPYPQQAPYYPQQQPYPQQPPAQQPPMVCPSCGKPTRPDETFCANCGARLQ